MNNTGQNAALFRENLMVAFYGNRPFAEMVNAAAWCLDLLSDKLIGELGGRDVLTGKQNKDVTMIPKKCTAGSDVSGGSRRSGTK